MQRRTTAQLRARIGLVTVALLTVGLTACATNDGSAGVESVELDVNLVHSTQSAYYLKMEEVAERIAERTEGRVTVEVFPDSQLGSNEDAAEQFLAGAPTVAHFNAGMAATLGGVEEYLALGSAYAVPSPDVIEPFVESDLYADWTTRLEANGFVVLAGNWFNGARQIISSEPGGHADPADLAGITIRIPAGQPFVTFFEATPALPVNLDPSETYTGMEQGTVDAAEGPLSQMLDWSLDELGKSVTMTNHMIEVTGFAMGADTWARISADDQQIVREEFARGGREYTEGVIAAADGLRADMEAAGIEFFEADLDAYRAIAEEATASSAAAQNWPAGLMDDIRAAMGLR